MGTVILNVSHTGYGDTERVCVGLGWLVVGGERGSVAVHLVRLQVQTEKGFKRTLFTRTKTQHANVCGNLLCQATKRHLNNS